MDRRIQKTRQSIMNAFIDLLAEKGLEKITINDIAERANINRGTVYLHYVDKFDLLDKCIEFYVERLLAHCVDRADTRLDISAFQRVFEFLEAHFTIYKLLLSNEGFGYFRKRLYAVIAGTVTEVVGVQSGNSSLANEVTTHFLTSGFIGVLEWWIQHSMPCSVQKTTEQLLFLLEPYTRHLVQAEVDGS
ncbi:TetR/AcrR family transcriptional regulator [Paenibacillus athensensis]|uniref:TetR family transcriptional regulator n=1 Tax=Paenibacillus athensensis TaxID=1967502 RepID=A0A4Y8PVD5_9BACL|nr:TetR/AcrR family transcriptional regulator [Paenibacillus athensensis]MCD1261843.1 TetR/AcrR family transcriptional regulator [Paenibacillus athensensis]